jgi:hypothetical protein
MLIPLKDGRRKSKKDMSAEELKDFEVAEGRALAVEPPPVKYNKHPGLRPAGAKDAKGDTGTSAKKVKAK